MYDLANSLKQFQQCHKFRGEIIEWKHATTWSRAQTHTRDTHATSADWPDCAQSNHKMRSDFIYSCAWMELGSLHLRGIAIAIQLEQRTNEAYNFRSFLRCYSSVLWIYVCVCISLQRFGIRVRTAATRMPAMTHWPQLNRPHYFQPL